MGIDERPLIPGESTTNDEDGDGLADAADLCPHTGVNTRADADDDGIGDDCDPRPNSPDERHFFAFVDGDLGALTTIGFVKQSPTDDPDSVIVGAVQDARS